MDIVINRRQKYKYLNNLKVLEKYGAKAAEIDLNKCAPDITTKEPTPEVLEALSITSEDQSHVGRLSKEFQESNNSRNTNCCTFAKN